MKAKHKPILIVATAFLLLLVATSAPASGTAPSNRATKEQLFKLQIPFVANEGQIGDEDVRYVARTFGGSISVTGQGELLYSLSSKAKSLAFREIILTPRMVEPRGIDPAVTRVNHYIGNDPSKWKTNIKTYNTVSLGEVYDGIMLSLRAWGNSVEKLFTVAPGADPTVIRLKMEGARSLMVSDSGELLLGMALGDIRFSKPVAFQEKDGKKIDVAVAYRAEKDTYAFSVGDYDKTLPLVIDPYFLAIGTYLGGSSDEGIGGIAVDTDGNIYVVGFTVSTDFPIYQAYQTYGDLNSDIFVTKLSPDGSSLVYSTYLGGASEDYGAGIAVDASGSAYVTGFTYSSNFPVTAGASQTAYGGNQDAFVTKFSPDGSSLVYSTYLGGSRSDRGAGIAVDTSGYAYVTGHTYTSSTGNNFPTTPGSFQTAPPNPMFGGRDAFVAKLNATGSSLVYSTFLGGNQDEEANGISVDASGCAYVTGSTKSFGFPITPGAFQTVHSINSSNKDAFVTKLAADGSSLVYSTFLGGAQLETGSPFMYADDIGVAIAVDASGCAYVTGWTVSADYPTTAGALRTSLSGYFDVFVAKFDATGSSLTYSTYFGGSGGDQVSGIALDPSGNVFVAGGTGSPDFPLTPDALQTSNPGAFVAKILPNGSVPPQQQLLYSTYLSTSPYISPWGIAVDSAGNVYVAGDTPASSIPVTPGAFQATHGGGDYDAFVIKLSLDTTAPSFALTVPQNKAEAPVGTNIEVVVSDAGSGVNTSSIVLQVNGTYVTPTITPSGTGGTQYTLSYDPPTDFGYTQQVTVTVSASDTAGNSSTQSFTFQTEFSENPYNPTGDDDQDGITNGVETTIGTDPAKRTLFVRPLVEVSSGGSEVCWGNPGASPRQCLIGQYVYWADFEGYLPLEPYASLGIEIRLIGSSGPYGTLDSQLRQFTYNPYTDGRSERPPCNILTVIKKQMTSYCGIPYNNNYGHIFLTSRATCSGAPTWSWDTKGYTPYTTADVNYHTEYGYYKPNIYPGTINNLFIEGAYTALTANEPVQITDLACDSQSDADCFSTTLRGSYNFDRGQGGDTGVEMQDGFVFDCNGTIVAAPAGAGPQYSLAAVFRRTIVHEMGHALLANDPSLDHCQSNCPLSANTLDFTLPGFCSGCATKLNGAGVILNHLHPRPAQNP